MRYLLERLRQVRTLYLAVYVALADSVLVFGIVPLELYARSALLQHGDDSRLLLGLLLANVCALAFVLSGMVASSVLLGRGAFRAAALLRPFLRQPSPVPVRARHLR